MDQLQQRPLLTCPTCGRHILSNDANATIAAVPVSCPSCGADMARAVSGQVPVDEAVTYRLQESPGPAPAVTDAPTAILAPPSGAASPAPARIPKSQPISPTAPGVEEPDQYRTASVSESNPAMSSSSTNGDPTTQSIGAPTYSELVSDTSPAAPATGAGVEERRDGWRNPWLVISMIMVLLVLFVAGILLSQNGNYSVTPQVTPAPVPTSTATAALPAGYVQVEDASGLYSFAVPPNWAPVPPPAATAEFTIYADPAHDVAFEVESFPTGTQQGGAAIDTAVLTENFPSLQASDLSAPTNVTLSGSTWVKESANVSLKPNGISQMEMVVVQTTTLERVHVYHFLLQPRLGRLQYRRPGSAADPQLLYLPGVRAGPPHLTTRRFPGYTRRRSSKTRVRVLETDTSHA